MAKDKQQKKKEREKRVAKEKLEAAKRRRQEQTPAETPKTPAKTFGATPGPSKVQGPSNLPRSTKQFTQRRSGGG